MSNIRKVGTKQWAMVVFSLILAASSQFIPLDERTSESSFTVAANAIDGNQAMTGEADRS